MTVRAISKITSYALPDSHTSASCCVAGITNPSMPSDFLVEALYAGRGVVRNHLAPELRPKADDEVHSSGGGPWFTDRGDGRGELLRISSRPEGRTPGRRARTFQERRFQLEACTCGHYIGRKCLRSTGDATSQSRRWLTQAFILKCDCNGKEIERSPAPKGLAVVDRSMAARRPGGCCGCWPR